MTAETTPANAVLTIDLAAVVANWRLLQRLVAPAACAAVVKADAYGLGVAPVARALHRAGCRTFFVACLAEAVAVRPHVADSAIYVLAGVPPGCEDAFVRHQLRPVLNSLIDIAAWRGFANRTAAAPPVAIHFDTGMSRLGLPPDEAARVRDEPDRLDGVAVACVMSHLACADQPDHPLNARQQAAFAGLRQRWPGVQMSLAASSGIFLGPAWHGDLCRPGLALYGGAPVPGRTNPMTQVVDLRARILQVREIDPGWSVGYGATHHARRRATIATAGVGYADGYLRSLSNRGHGYIGDIRVPLVGRVSMDLITFDASAVPAALLAPGAEVELIGPHIGIDAVAADAGTIAYEILTSLGGRYRRVYRGGVDGPSERDAATGADADGLEANGGR